jgi:flagella basal body P-ring formation protein FlgA
VSRPARKQFFFEPFRAARCRLRGYAASSSGRETQKTFAPGGIGSGTRKHSVDANLTWLRQGQQEQKFFARFFSKKRLLIPTVIKNDRWYKPYLWRAAAPPTPRAAPNATKDESSFVAFGITCLLPFLLCGATQDPSQDPTQLGAAVRQAALAIAPPGASITLGSLQGASVMPACTSPLSVTLSGIAPYEQAAAHCPAPGWTLYVTVTVAQVQNVVVAARPIGPGQVLGPADLMLAPEPVARYAGREVFYDPAQLIGTDALMALPAGTILCADAISQPVVVKAGQMVAVQVISGSVEVSIDAVADETGRIGDTILLTNPSSGRRFTATLTANGPVVNLQS